MGQKGETNDGTTCQKMEIEKKPEISVLLKHVTKKANVGTLVRSSVALGAKELGFISSNAARITEGLHRPSTPNLFGSHGSAGHLPLRHFTSLEEAKTFHSSRGTVIVGVEIHPNAVPVQSFQWTKSVCILLGNEGDGLSPSELEICDALVYIPQYSQGTASLNVVVAASIILHSFAVWAQFQESSRIGDKFIVVEKKGVSVLNANVASEEEMQATLRLARRDKLNRSLQPNEEDYDTSLEIE